MSRRELSAKMEANKFALSCALWASVPSGFVIGGFVIQITKAQIETKCTENKNKKSVDYSKYFILAFASGFTR